MLLKKPITHHYFLNLLIDIKMKNVLILLALMLYYTTFSVGQNNSLMPIIEDFTFMQGNWTGVLEYTDYQDDKTKVVLKTTTNYRILDKKLLIQTTYIEPNGVPVYSKGQISISRKGDKISFNDDLFTLSEKTVGRLVLTREGKDNEKKSLIRETIDYTKDDLTITKEIKYEGSNEFLLRHKYGFQRESAEATQMRLLNNALGTWELDLRPSPDAEPYLKDFIIESLKDGKLSGVFYGTPFKNGKINTVWGKLYFSFSTADQSNAYYHSGYLDEGRLYGTSFSEERGLMMPWFSTKKKS